MRLNDNDRVRITVTAVTSVDPSTGTLVLVLDDDEYPCTWDGAATQSGGRWTRTAHTTSYFAGPAVPEESVDAATVLTRGIHTAELRVTIGPTIVAAELPTITVH